MPHRIAVIADIHSNAAALERVLEDIRRRGVQQIINLGDSVYGPLKPARTPTLLRGAAVQSVVGNEDCLFDLSGAVLASHPTIRFVLDQLSPTDVDDLRALPATRQIGEKVLACHGTPVSDETYLLETVTEHGAELSRPAAIWERMAAQDEVEVVLCGHSHLPRAVWLDGTLILNPGSVGLPAYADALPFPHRMETGSPHARYAVLNRDQDGWSAEQVVLPYDWQAAAEMAAQTGPGGSKQDGQSWVAHEPWKRV